LDIELDGMMTCGCGLVPGPQDHLAVVTADDAVGIDVDVAGQKKRLGGCLPKRMEGFQLIEQARCDLVKGDLGIDCQPVTIVLRSGLRRQLCQQLFLKGFKLFDTQRKACRHGVSAKMFQMGFTGRQETVKIDTGDTPG
jgi:hypothetical protein